MKHFFSKVLLIITIIVFATCLLSQAASLKAGRNKPSTSDARKTASRVLGYSFVDDSHQWPAGDSYKKGRIPLATMTSTAANASPGVTVGYTWYDYQHNNSIGRMIETGPYAGETGATIVHMSWMHLPDSVYEGRTYMYNAYKSVDHSFAGAFRLHNAEEKYSGYVNIDVTPDNRALVGGHCDEKGPVPYQAHIHFDACPACELFDTYVRVPDSLGGYEQVENGESLWPKFLLQFGTDTVLHVVTRNSGYLGSLMYFRMVGYEGSSEWDYPPYCFDTVQIYAHVIGGQRVGNRVALGWLSSPPYQEPDCDTCSGLTVYDGYQAGQMDNDVYVQVSEDQGVTWEPRQNLTQLQIGEAGYRAYCDVSMMFDQDDYLHVIWQGVPWPADLCIDQGGWCFTDDWYIDATRIFHWSENIPYIRTICDHTYIPSDSCGPPTHWSTTVAKMSLSECDGKLYTIFSQFNDLPHGIINDCAQWGYDQGAWGGPANADIWVSISSDNGMTWDAQRNLTNSYTPHCDPWGADDCQSDYWPSMNRWGRQVQTGEDWSMAEVVDPSGGSSPTDYYLDIQYLNDLDAGAIIWEDDPEGTWTNNPVKWFRMPCVEPVPNPLFIPEWTYFGDPNYNLVGEEKFVDLDFENAGNVALTYSITIEEDNGPAGWLTVSGFSGSVPSGLGNVETGTVIVNTGGIITTTGNYYGRLHVEGNDPTNLPADIEVELIIANDFCLVNYDVVNTSCLSLSVANYGNVGRDGYGKVNMDYYPEDCDSTATVYLYDGSPFVGQVVADDTTFTLGVWGAGFLDDYGFRPLCADGYVTNCFGGEVFQSGTFVTQDSTLAFSKAVVAPGDDCEFILEYMMVWSFDGSTHDDLMLGEVIDWDVPWDYHADDEDQSGHTAVNTGGTDGPRSLLYQQGYEAYGAGGDTLYPFNCQYNDERFAGNAFIESYLNGSPRMGAPYGGFIGENDSLVYPASEGFVFGTFWQEAIVSGLRGIDSTEDLCAAMVFEPYLDIGATDVYEVVTVLATIEQGTLADLQQVIDDANAWYTAQGGMAMFADDDGMNGIDECEGCCELMGDFDHDGDLDPLDVVAFVNWMWRGGPGPVCPEEVDVNCMGGIDPLDAVYIVNYFWRGGPAPCTCGDLP